jgi:Rrf2 family transcriptional regulator, nitric oxide-sensitive transcriptional repressor
MFTQTTEYALRAMAWIAVLDGDLVPTPVLAAKTQVPANYLAKVLQQLAGAKLVVGRRGVGGGYRLARPAREISLLEIVRCITPVDRVGACPVGDRNRDGHLCPLHEAKDRAAAAIIEIFGGVTLADLQRDVDHRPCQSSSRGALAPA